MERGFDPAREYLKTQHLEAEYECRTAHKAIKQEEEKLAKRRRSCENAAQRCKDYLSHALDGEKLKTARVSVFYKSSESVTIDDLGSLAEEYIRIPEPQADKTAIKKAIKAGETVTGAHIETSKSVIVR